MNNRFQITTAATIVASCLALRAGAAVPQTQQDLTPEIQAIRARIEQLESANKAAEQKRLQAVQQRDERLTQDELRDDAVRSDQLLTAEGFTAGYTDNKFVIQSADGNFLLRPWFHFQFRDVTLLRKDFQGTTKHPDDELDNGFEVRQFRFGFEGNVFSPDVYYFLNWATQRTSASATVKSSTGTTVGTVSNNLGGVPVLQQAYVRYHFPTTPFFIKVGQFKDPVMHEQIVDTRYQEMAERSLTSDIFLNGDAYTEGVSFIYDPLTFIRGELTVNHGMRSSNTNFLDYANNGSFNPFNYGFAGRVEYKYMGRWADYTQVDAVGTKEPLLVFGSGADYTERGRSGQLVVAADAMYASPTGLFLYGELLDRYTTHNFGAYLPTATGAALITPDPAVAGRHSNEYAMVLQGGYLIGGHFEPFGRYEFIHVQGDAAGSHNWIQAITAGANYYFYGHRLKLTGEVVYLPNGLPFDDSPNDVLTNSNGKTELSFIAQLQFAL